MTKEIINSSWETLYKEFEFDKESPLFVEQLKMIFFIGASSGAYIASQAWANNSKKDKELLLKEIEEFTTVPIKH